MSSAPKSLLVGRVKPYLYQLCKLYVSSDKLKKKINGANQQFLFHKANKE